MHLAKLQQIMQRYLLDSSPSIEPLFALAAQDGLAERLAIYKDAYYLRLLGALKRDYPSLQRYWGKACFNKHMLKYLECYPSRSFTIKSLGASFPQFMQTYFPEDKLGFELSQFEWNLNQALYAANVIPLSLTQLKNWQADEWSSLCFNLNPSVCLQSCYYNIPESWAELQKEPVQLSLHSELRYYLIWRKKFQVYFGCLDKAELYFFELLQTPKSFVELCEAMATILDEEEVVTQLSHYIQKWISEEVFVLLN